jgi:hypothetical protein
MPRAGTVDRLKRDINPVTGRPPTVFVMIGNSDDKLTQREWHDLCGDAEVLVLQYGIRIHGNWRSKSDDPWQNACWCYEAWPHLMDEAKVSWAKLAAKYRQDSVAFSEARETLFLGPQWLEVEGG